MDEIDNFLDRYQVPKLKQDQINYVNSPVNTKEIEAVINSLPRKKNKQTKSKKQNKQTNKQKQDQMGLVQNSVRPSKNT